MIQKITPNLWFNEVAKEAAEFYVSVFPNSKITNTSYYPTEGLLDFQEPFAGKELTIDFELDGQRFAAINAGPEFKFTEAVSFVVTCKDQEEIDYYWEKLSKDPAAEQCGWCKDQYGLSWQIVPEDMDKLLEKPGAFPKLLEMYKIVIADF
jgi:predicted 3-demethylubiquinone-9 3-methyltransferase (glyoxalase superfamily)